MERVAVLDFETTGLSPGMGDRPTEIAIAVVEGQRVVDRFQSLMNPGRRIPADVTRLTGITNDMVAAAPTVAKVMHEAVRFVGRLPLVAHNASFDRKFWQAELDRLSMTHDGAFACTMLLSRRLYPDCPDHKLGTLVETLGLPKAGRAHRAMMDVEMTCHLWRRIGRDVASTFKVRGVCHELLVRVQVTPRSQLHRVLAAPQ